MTLSLLAGVGLVAAALHAPGLLAEAVPTSLPAAARPDPAQSGAARAQAALVGQEDERLLAQLRAVPWNTGPYLDILHGAPALVLTPSRSPYDLNSLLDLGAATRVDPGTVDLTTSVLVAPGADLVLHAPDTTLRMASGPTGFTSIVGWKATVALTGDPERPLTVRSWDAAAAGPDVTARDGRAYVRVVGGGLRTSDAAVLDLGFWSGRTGGLALTGDAGTAATGSITDTRVSRGHYGLYSEDSENLVVDGAVFDGSAADGVLLHRGSTGATVSNSSARDNGGNGVAADRGASEVTLRAVVAEYNSADGIRVDGRPLAERPGPAGMSLDGFAGFQVLDSASRSNGGSGILVWDADDVIVRGNEVTAGGEGIVVRGASERVRVAANTVTRTAGVAVAVRGGATLTDVGDNTIFGADTGVQVRDAVARVHDNVVDDARVHGVSFQGAANGSSAERNILSGQGSSSVDLRRLAPGAAVAAGGNLDEGWLVVRSGEQRLHDLLDHPLLALWALLFLAPVAATVLTRRKTRVRTPSAGTLYAGDLYAAPIGVAGGPPMIGPSPGRRAGEPPGRRRSPEGSNTRVTVVGPR